MAGDIGARFYDSNGKELDHGWSDRIVGISLEQLRRIPFVIGMAAGKDKALGVIGAIRGGFVSEVIISSSCAFEIIRILSDAKQTRVAS
jgi:DNA-binding transcriptional regulator LsrR (DeoR family)